MIRTTHHWRDDDDNLVGKSSNFYISPRAFETLSLVDLVDPGHAPDLGADANDPDRYLKMLILTLCAQRDLAASCGNYEQLAAAELALAEAHKLLVAREADGRPGEADEKPESPAAPREAVRVVETARAVVAERTNRKRLKDSAILRRLVEFACVVYLLGVLSAVLSLAIAEGWLR